MRTQIDLLREQLASQIALRGVSHPQIEHLRWQIASLERQARLREGASGMFGVARRADPADDKRERTGRPTARGGT
jgi:hypothetical protein